MAASDPAFASQDVSSDDLRAERASFDGTLLAALAYGEFPRFVVEVTISTGFWKGALLMLYIQLIQVLLGKPKRGRTFWAIVAFSSTLFPLATLAIAGVFRFDELLYIDHQNFPGGLVAFRRAYMSDASNLMSQTWSVMITSGQDDA